MMFFVNEPASSTSALMPTRHDWTLQEVRALYDLPLLEMVSRPVAVNPVPQLLELARERGWQIMSL